jgi:DNA gyrase/topoisomerase IV subunit A
LLDILAKEERVLTIIKTELLAIKEKYATSRLTDLVPDEGEIAIEDLIANEGRHHHDHAQRSHQAHERQLLSRSTPRRQRRHRHDHKGRRDRRRSGFRRALVHGQHA